MYTFNQFQVIGNLIKNPLIKTTNSGHDFAKVTIVTTRSKKVGEQWENIPDYHEIVIFGKMVKHISKLSKGDKLAVIGSIQSSSWEDEEGNKRYGKNFVANQIVLLNPKKEDVGDKMQQEIKEETPQPTATPPKPEPVVTQEQDISDVFGGGLDI
jgi:single-strand DNA-binding protein